MQNKITSILNNIKSIEEKNFKKYQPYFNQKESQKSNISNKSEFKEITLNEKEGAIKNHITINNNYYTIINTMTMGNINDNNIDKLDNNNIKFLKIDDDLPNYNDIIYYKSQTSKNKSNNFYCNSKIKSRNRSNNNVNAKHLKENSYISFNDNKTKFRFNLSLNKNKLNNSFVNKRKNSQNNKDSKINIMLIHNKNISLREKIHLFHLKRQALLNLLNIFFNKYYFFPKI